MQRGSGRWWGCRFSPCDEISAERGELTFEKVTISGANCDADTKLASVEGLTGVKGRLIGGWREIPRAFPKSLNDLTEK